MPRIKTKPTMPWKIWCNIVWLLSGEWMLDRYPNGGDVILGRSILITLLSTFFIFELKDICDPSRVFAFSLDWHHVAHLVGTNLGIAGAVFAGSYTALYARFSSQWNYLANLYNQQMQVGITADFEKKKDGEDPADTYSRWCAGFVEDAWCLHLARKPLFAEAICQQLDKENIAFYVKASLAENFPKLLLAVGWHASPKEDADDAAAHRD